MMDKRKKTFITASIMTLGLLSCFTIGLSSWLIVNEDPLPASATIKGADIVGATDEDTIPNGFSLDITTPKVGIYTYEQNGENLTQADIIYSFTFDPSKFTGSLRGITSFYMSGTLGLLYYDGETTKEYESFFDDQGIYMKKVFTWGGASKTAGFVNGNYVYSIPELDVDISGKTTINLIFTMREACLYNATIRKLLKLDTTKFQLKLKVGTKQ